MGKNHGEHAEMGHTKLSKLDVDNLELNDYHSAVTSSLLKK
jgi:hypothetical protein